MSTVAQADTAGVADCDGGSATAHALPGLPVLPALPQLPALPPLPSLADLPGLLGLPALPALPALDLTMLLKPITDLLGTFGTGQLGGSSSGNPGQVHQQLAQSLESGVTTLLGAVKSLDGGWAGQGAMSAITAATKTAGEAATVATQGLGMSVDLQAAAAVVAAGFAELQGIVVKTAGLLAATAPTIVTPPGQIAALGIAAEGLAEGLAVVTATRAQLLAPTANMATNGTPVPVTPIPGPGGGDGFATAAKLLESALPLVQAGVGMLSTVLGGTGTPPGPTGPTSGDPTSPTTPGTTVPATSTCPPSCEKGSPTPTPGTPKAGAPASPVPGASPTAGAPTPSVPAATLSAPTQPPAPLADCPSTTNASVTTTQPAPANAVQVSAAGTGASGPMAPMTPVAARSGTELPRTVPAATLSVDPDPQASPIAPDELTALTSQSLHFDVALALGLGDADHPTPA